MTSSLSPWRLGFSQREVVLDVEEETSRPMSVKRG